MNNNRSERTPLLANNGGGAGDIDDAGVLGSSTRLFIYYTNLASVGTGVLTLIFLAISMIIMTGRPRDYYPPYDLAYNFAPTAGFSIVAITHSLLTAIRLNYGSPSPQGLAGILVDIFAGGSLLFQSLYGMQNFLYPYTYYGTLYGCREPYNKSRPVDSDCEPWARRAEPVFWCYFIIMLIFGTSHVILLFLRASLYKGRDKILRVRLVGQEGLAVQA